MTSAALLRAGVALATSASLALLVACSSSSSPAQSGHDSGAPADAGTSCFMNPTTYVEIINACTDAAFVDKKPVVPLLLADGGLPPLP